MATVALDRDAGRIRAAVTIDRGMLRSFLERDRLLAAYAICDLDEREFQRARWAAATRGEEVLAVAVEYGGLSPQPLFVMGREDGVEALLRDVVRPRLTYVAASADVLPAVQRHYRLEPGPQMVRMWVDAARFQPKVVDGVEPLKPSDAGELNRLYRLGFGSWLPPQSVAEGVYYGVRVGRRLVAAAGTHVIGRDAKIAVVGTVLTQPEYRGRGYAEATTSAVTAELLRFCDHVVLNVRADNPPALNAYRRLGYAEHARFEERLAHRTDSLLAGLAAAIRRRLTPREEPRA
ncbi:MAG TPA: GNAT family N-acetyltransferase [Candidatus Limnocylindrales bacterium]